MTQAHYLRQTCCLGFTRIDGHLGGGALNRKRRDQTHQHGGGKNAVKEVLKGAAYNWIHVFVGSSSPPQTARCGGSPRNRTPRGRPRQSVASTLVGARRCSSPRESAGPRTRSWSAGFCVCRSACRGSNTCPSERPSMDQAVSRVHDVVHAPRE